MNERLENVYMLSGFLLSLDDLEPYWKYKPAPEFWIRDQKTKEGKGLVFFIDISYQILSKYGTWQGLPKPRPGLC